MIKTTKFTSIQAIIIQDICRTQLAAVIDLKSNWQIEYPEIIYELEQQGLGDQDYFSTLVDIENNLNRVLNNPEELFSINIIKLNTLLTILNKMEDKYKYKYPVAVSSLFKKFFFVQDLHNQPQFTIHN